MRLPLILTAGPLLAVVAAPAAARAACYVAFVHGSGENFHDEPSGSPALVAYWSHTGGADASFAHAVGRGAGDCALWWVGYDGNQQWWSDRAAGRVAVSLGEFIRQHQIPDGGLTVIGHSMGGVVLRYVVNNGTPASPYYNEYAGWDPRMDYDLVRRKTGRLISIQAPHTGAQAADALFGNADNTLTNSSAGLIKILGMREVTNATGVMTRPYMESAGARGGEMGDEGRQVTLHTIAGYDSEEKSGMDTENDSKLATAWNLLCYRRGPSNSWGAACQWDVWNFKIVPGDGLVEHASAHGLWLRGNPSGTGAILGARRGWLDLAHNHNQARYNAHWAEIWNYHRSVRSKDVPGNYVGHHLP